MHVLVTPLAGVWIEITLLYPLSALHLVTPLAGVWIEIKSSTALEEMLQRHSPCGSVD